jgi:hypothetical protein
MDLLQKDLGIYYGFGDECDAEDVHNMPLDEVENVAGVKLRELYEARRSGGASFATAALEVLLFASSFAALLICTESFEANHVETTADKWLCHLKQMVAFGILIVSTRDSVWYCSKYFAVPKGISGLARTIHNTRKLNKRFHEPNNVNLCPLALQLRLMAQLVSRSACEISFFNCDIRNYYHQLGIPDNATRIFGVRCGGEYFRYRSLPMGWKHSCAIAQAVSWALITHVNGDEDRLGAQVLEGDSMPQYLELKDPVGTVVGYVFLTYDNIGVIGPFALAQQWAKRIQRNARQFNVMLKHADVHQLSRDWHGPRWLGVELLQFGRTLIWRHQEEKLGAWRELRDAIATRGPITPKMAARAVGVILWHATVSLTALCHVQSSIDVLQRAAKHVGGKVPMWKRPDFALSDDERCVLLRELDRTLRNDWKTFDTRDRTAVFFASDAELEGLGVVDLSDREKQSVRFWRARVSNTEHIFFREMEAALWAIELALQVYGDGIAIHLAVDNTAAVHCLRRMHSTTRTGSMIVKRVDFLLQAHSATLTVVGVRGIDNVADCPSRGSDSLQPKRIDATLSVFRDFLSGRGKTQKVVNKFNAGIDEGGRRHVEPEDELDKQLDEIANELASAEVS